MYYFDNYSVNTYKTVHRTRLIGVFFVGNYWNEWKSTYICLWKM